MYNRTSRPTSDLRLTYYQHTRFASLQLALYLRGACDVGGRPTISRAAFFGSERSAPIALVPTATLAARAITYDAKHTLSIRTTRRMACASPSQARPCRFHRTYGTCTQVSPPRYQNHRTFRPSFRCSACKPAHSTTRKSKRKRSTKVLRCVEPPVLDWPLRSTRWHT